VHVHEQLGDRRTTVCRTLLHAVLRDRVQEVDQE
jgi:hypothetical protein